MKQNNIIIVSIIFILLIAGGLWYMFSPADLDDNTAQSAEQVSTSGNNQVQTVKKVDSLGSLAKQGGNYTCTISTIADSGKTTGTVYASNGKTRFDFRAQDVDGTVINVHTIRNGSLAYTWVDGQTKGTKTAITTSSAVVPQPSGAVIQVDDDEQVSSECRPWSPVISMFTPPVGITF